MQLAGVILALAKDRAKPDVDELVESALVVFGQTGPAVTRAEK
jgi:hypothetical protein